MGETAVHRALADDRRARLVEELRAAGALDAHELSRRVGLHPNTVRWHLGILAEAGLVASRPEERTAPGRPRIVYEASTSARESRSDEYRLLATILAGTVSGSEGGPAAAESAGRAWGRFLVRRPAPFTRVSEAEATDAVVGVLDGQGFQPEAVPGEIRMRRCPFHDLAEEHPKVVCAVHRGLVSGAYEELGVDLEVDRLDVFVRPDLCVAHLARPRGRPPESGYTAQAPPT